MNQVINKRLKTTNIEALKEGDEAITDNKSIADAMNSFFCNVGKSLAEKIAPKPSELYDYLNRNKLILLQSAFRKLHSVLTCLHKSTNDWYLSIDKGRYTAAVFIDLKKAFDTVNHEILFNKLNCYGVRGKELSWFWSHLFQ